MEKLSPETLFNFPRLHCCGGHTSQRPLLRFFSLSVACTSLKKIQLKTGFMSVFFLGGVDFHTVGIFPVLVLIDDRRVCSASVPSL